MKFNMKVDQNFASFTDDEGVMVFVDSFDNKTFEVRIGKATDSASVGSVKATSAQELNEGILNLYNEFKKK